MTIVEMLDEIARDMLFLNRTSLLRDLAANDVRVLTSTTVTEITPSGVRVSGPDGDATIEADTVVAAFGVTPEMGLAEQPTSRGLPVHAVGDCVEPRKVGDAINEAYVAAYSL